MELIAGLAILSGPPVAEAAAKEDSVRPVPTIWYVSVVVSSRAGYRVTHYWSNGPNMRSQTMVGIHPVTTIVRGDHYWAYDTLSQEGIEIVRSPAAVAEDQNRGRPFGNDLEDIIRSHGEKIETGEIGGIPTETWRATNEVGRRTVWVTASEPKVPLRVENFDRESSETATLNYSNWASDFELPDRAFEVPPGLQLEKFSYDEYVEKSLEGMPGSIPVLHPKLLHGARPR